MSDSTKKEPHRSIAHKIWSALTRVAYTNDKEKLEDAQAFIWLSMGIIGINLIIFLIQTAR